MKWGLPKLSFIQSLCSRIPPGQNRARKTVNKTLHFGSIQATPAGGLDLHMTSNRLPKIGVRVRVPCDRARATTQQAQQGRMSGPVGLLASTGTGTGMYRDRHTHVSQLVSAGHRGF